MTPSNLFRLLLTWVCLPICCVSCSEDSEKQQNAPILIQPNVSVGKIHAGMRVQDVIAQLGEPKRRTANALEYTPLGFAVMPNRDGIVQVVMCGDVTGLSGPLVKAFTGRTKEGIGLTSTREELLKTFGEPTSDQKMMGGAESIRYDSLGMTFTLESDKIYHMIVRLGVVEKEPDRTVTLEPGPAGQ